MSELDIQQIEYRVRHVISDQLGVSIDSVKDAARLHDDLGADSLDMVELVLALEVGFDIQIADDAALEVSTVRQVIDLVVGFLTQDESQAALDFDAEATPS